MRTTTTYAAILQASDAASAAQRAAQRAADHAAYELLSEQQWLGWGPAALAALGAAGIRGYRDDGRIRCFPPEDCSLMGSGSGCCMPMIEVRRAEDPVEVYRAQVAQYMSDDIAQSRERYATAFASLARALEVCARVGDGATLVQRPRTVRVARSTVRVYAHEYEGAYASHWENSFDLDVPAHDAEVIEQWAVGSLGEELLTD